jgi:hypothetical protein
MWGCAEPWEKVLGLGRRLLEEGRPARGRAARTGPSFFFCFFGEWFVRGKVNFFFLLHTHAKRRRGGRVRQRSAHGLVRSAVDHIQDFFLL